MVKRALISGVSGQAGIFLAHHLLKMGYEVYGMIRRTAQRDFTLLDILSKKDNFHLVHGDITDYANIMHLMQSINPDEFYNLAAQAHVGKSWEYPLATVETTGIGVLHVLEAVRQIKPDCRVLQISSSEMFGNEIEKDTQGENFVALNEESSLLAVSPYAAAKIFAHNLVNVYRQSYNLFVATAIAFNYESTIRGVDYVTKKITQTLAKIFHGKMDTIQLGNMNSKRDWGHAQDTVRCFHKILQHNKPDNFVIATGQTWSVQDFFEEACNYFGFDTATRRDILEINPDFVRPKDVNVLLGDASKAKRALGWEPKISFQRLVANMCEYDDQVEGGTPLIDELREGIIFPEEFDNE